MNRFFTPILLAVLILLGTGAVQIEAQTYNSVAPAITLCNKCVGERGCVPCNGTGRYAGYPCAICTGSGLCYYCDGTGRF